MVCVALLLMASVGYSVGLSLLLHLELEGEKTALENLHL